MNLDQRYVKYEQKRTTYVTYRCAASETAVMVREENTERRNCIKLELCDIIP